MVGQTEHAHDLFISYAEADRAWVEGYLLDALTQAGVRCHSEAAFALGVPRLLEFERAVRESQRTLLVLTPAYLAGGFVQFTDLLAQSYGLETATWPVIPLVLEPVALPPRLAMLTALDAADPDNWPAAIARLCETLQRPVPGPAPKAACPYPGMVPFGEADSERFFGRDEEVQELLERLRLHRFLTVIGPSGSGKSSLVFAGLVPALRESGLFGAGGWLVRVVRPGETPSDALVDALGGDVSDLARAAPRLLSADPDARRLLLVVDQFEELFTLARPDDVEPFQQALLELVGVPNGYVVLTVRADFYPDLMATPLWPQVQAHRMEVLPLGEEGLRQAIVRPAEGVGVYVETALVERLVADAGREPGVLPLVQETLVLLWERLERRFLPLSAYEALVLPRAAYGGPERTGLQVAMARRADAALAELTVEQQAIARRVFLRLVQFGEGRADTRRQQPVAALRVAGDEPGMFDRTLEHLTHSRLLTLSGEEEADGRRVDIAHESLIGGWPTLQEWVGERREAEQTRRRLEGKAGEWERLGRGSGGLLDEVELLEAERWLESGDAAELGVGEALPALVEASRAAQEEAAAQKRRVARFRLGALGAIGALIIVALGIGWWSARQNAANLEAIAERERRLGQQQQEAAATAQALADAEATARAEAEAERDRAEQLADRAMSGQLAAQAQAVLKTYPQRSLLLASEALNITLERGEPRVPAAEQALRDALAHSGGHVLGGHDDRINTVAISPDGRWLATGSDDTTARLWDLTSSGLDTSPIVLQGHEDSVTAVAFSSDGHWLVTGSEDTTAFLWDLTADDRTAGPILLLGHEGAISAIAVSPDSHWLVTGSEDSTARLWDLTAPDPAAAPVVLRGHDGRINAVAVSPDSHWLVTGSEDDTARLWDLAALDPTAAPIVLNHESPINAVAFSPDNRWLASGCRDSVHLWDLTAPDLSIAPLILRGHKGIIGAVVISPDSRWLVTGGENPIPGDWKQPSAYLWDLTASDPASAPIVLRGPEGDFAAMAISPDSRWLVTGGRNRHPGDWEDNTVYLWDLTASDPASAPTVLRGHDGAVNAVAISSDNRWLVTGSEDHTARIWDLTAASPFVAPIVLRGPTSYVLAAAISPDNHWLVSGDLRGDVHLWDLIDPTADPILLPGHEGTISAVAISPNNHWLVTGSNDATARLWDLTAPDPAAAPIVLRGHAHIVYAVAISPDNHWLVTGGYDGTAILWDLTAPDPTAAPIVLRGHEDSVRALAISPDNHWLVTGSNDATVCLWDLTAPDPAAAPVVLRGHEDWISTVAVSPDNHWLVTGSGDHTACLWDLTAPDLTAETIVLRGHEEAISTVAISPDNHWLATAGWEHTARLWDLTDPDPTAEPIVLHGHRDIIRAVAFSSDSHWLVTAGQDHTARLWDLTAPDPTAEPIILRGHRDDIFAVAISPDNHWLATGSRDVTVHLWNLRLDELMDLACRTAGRNLTRAEWEQYFPGQEYRETCKQWPLENE